MPIIIVNEIFDDPTKTLNQNNIRRISDNDTVIAAILAQPDGEGEHNVTTILNGHPKEVLIAIKQLYDQAIEQIVQLNI
jgi:hypothetical protein